MSLLGDDGRGYELARKLESAGIWRTWLGDSNYTNFAPF
ncbi:mediator of RNA polymerase II transcription subunit 15A-like, partial [Trifolium medium]|nr:mediator of RNA polymerase II transcription subunit 15A-like [Trifolium medium]